MTDLIHPPRLARGSHNPATGVGCGMNVLAYERGETSDYPSHVATPLARLVQEINDHICAHVHTEWVHGLPATVLCPPCSRAVLALAHRTADTAEPSRERLWMVTATVMRRLLAEVDPSSRLGHYIRLAVHAAQRVARGDHGTPIPVPDADLATDDDAGVRRRIMLGTDVLVAAGRVRRGDAPSETALSDVFARWACRDADRAVEDDSIGNPDQVWRRAHELLTVWHQYTATGDTAVAA